MASPPYLLDHLDDISHIASLAPLGLVTDIDGTISEIAPTPQEARVSPSIRRKLARLASHLAVVAAVSGRTAEQARQMVGADGLLYVGNHGLEYLSGGELELTAEARPYLPAIASALEALKRRLNVEGLLFEEKLATAAIHYRAAADPSAARAAILEALRRLPQAKELAIAEGKMVVELRPPVPVDKGTALRDIVKRYGLAGLFYVGDDRTDLDAFLALAELRRTGACQGISIAVAGAETPSQVVEAADYRVSSVADVEGFLSWLLERLPR
ncbi:MAG: trehalose-phosphatase [Chloroflexi bacterium]|nr:trehalose-phosphatase [Chloroflexota bacterium]